jgi:hypothetical protein
VQLFQQRQGLTGQLLGDQQPRQDQVLALVGVARLVPGGEAALGDPADGSGQLALGQQQPRPLHRGREDQVGDRLSAGQDPLGVLDGGEGAGLVAARLADPGEGGQACHPPLGVAEPPTQFDTLVGMVKGGVQLVLLPQDLGQADMRHPRGRPRRRAGRLGLVEGLPAGGQRGPAGPGPAGPG